MKRVISVLLVFVMCFSLLVACGTKPTENNDSTNAGTPTTEPYTDVETTEPDPTEDTEVTQPEYTEPEKFYNVVHATALSPKFTYASNANCAGMDVGAIADTEDPIYVIAIRVLIDTNTYSTSDALVIPSLKDDQYWITKHVQSYLLDTNEICPNPQGYIYDSTYIIEYTSNPDEDVWVETISGDKVMNLSTVTYDKEIKTSGDVEMYECAMVEDEYGTKHYVIATGSGSDYAAKGNYAEDIGRGWYNFDLIQLGAVENVPTDLDHLSEFFWYPENVSVEYDGLAYKNAPSEEANTVYVSDSSFEDFEKWYRDVSRYRISLEFRSQNNDLFANDSTVYLNFEGVRFVFNLDKWD